jgi:hypothetical protein
MLMKVKKLRRRKVDCKKKSDSRKEVGKAERNKNSVTLNFCRLETKKALGEFGGRHSEVFLCFE